MYHYFKTVLTVALVVFVGVSLKAQTYVETSISNLESGDVVLIVDVASGRLLSHKTTKKGPEAKAVGIESGKIEGNLEDDEWTINVGTQTIGGESVNVYSFNGGEGRNLYNISDNAGVKIGKNAATDFIWSVVTVDGVQKGYLKSTNNINRYVGVYTGNYDWRSYTSYNTNIAATVTAFFKKEFSATPIVNVKADENSLESEVKIYDMNGRRVSTMQSGRMYIVNGKKVIKK